VRRLITGDAFDELMWLPDNSIDSCVTDPPYALVSVSKRFGADNAAPAKSNGPTGVYGRASAGFMGQKWDTGETAFNPAFWAEVLRVLKPGGYVLAFGGTRTYHRLACAIDDGGFEIRDQIGWLYGSGFPKSHNQHDKWEGFGTALKPAWEPIVMARKPLIGTVAANLLEWGCGAINVDGCRVEGEPWKAHDATGLAKVKFFTNGEAPVVHKEPHNLGRWPANIIHDGSEEVLAAFPNAKGQQGDVRGDEPSECHSGVYSGPRGRQAFGKRSDSGSAARFFYCAKASKSDRNDGCGELPDQEWRDMGAPVPQRAERPFLPSKNNHPTVKPTELMRYLCRLVTPPGGVVLDPFMGSGSTGRGAVLEGFGFVGIEMMENYAAIAAARIAAVEPEDMLD
jgi:site-specific DNA-methyltransferase (adenine-specific)